MIEMTVIQNILLALMLFIIQPTFLVGLALIFLSKSRRYKYTRRQLRAAIYKENFELKRFFLWGLLPGLILSILSVAIGLPVTIDWIIAYHIVTLLSLGLGYRFIHPIFTFSGSALLLFIYSRFVSAESVFAPILNRWNSPFVQEEAVGYEALQIVFILTLLILLSTVLTMHIGQLKQFIPRFLKTKRGKLVARYRMNPLWLIPLVVIIPGETFTQLFNWWPVFSIGNQTYSFLVVPVLLGFRYTVQAQIPTQAKNALLKDLLTLGIIGIVLFALTFWRVQAAAVGLGFLMVGGVYVLYRHRLRERKWTFRFGPDQDGLRVVAVRPGTPADKMNLEIGDVLLESHNVKLTTSEDLVESLFHNRAYSKLKVKRIDGELIMVETAIYEDDPHDLGLITLESISLVNKK